MGFAGAGEGVPGDEIVKGLAKIGNEFLGIRQKISEANDEFLAFKTNARKDAVFALRAGNVDGLTSAGDAVGQARMSSLSGIQERKGQLENYIARAAPYENNNLQTQQFVHGLRQQLAELEKAERTLKKSFGPVGEALFGLEKYGLDVEKASKGGMEGLLALSDAMQKVDDPTQRLRFAIQLFGEDAGAKMVPLLEGGRTAIENYRKELERLGGVVSKKDTQIGEAYEASAENFRRSISGVKMAVAREVLPLLTESTDAITEFMVSYRERIAGILKDGFVYARNLVSDIIGVFQGKRTGFKTPWLDTLFEKLEGARKYISEMYGELKKLWDGEDSRFEWLNKIRDGIQTAIKFVKDLYAILTGQDASEFKWLNDLRDQAKAFGADFMAALEMVKTVLTAIHSLLQPVADLFGIDVTTMLLFVGMTKFIGLFGLASTAAGQLMKVLGTLFALGGGGALAKGIAGIATAATGASAVGGVGSAVGAAGALGLGARAGILGVAAVGGGLIGWEVGKKAYEVTGWKDSDEARQSEVQKNLKIKYDADFDAAFARYDRKRQGDWFRSRGVNTQMGLETAHHLPGGVLDVWKNPLSDSDRDFIKYMKENNDKSKGSTETVNVNLTLNDRNLGTLQTDPLTARKMNQTLYSMQQKGGY
ncbi:Phage tail protein [Ochrobactrum soli]|uniref:Phage tail protein n=1 Tax=Ochrobactrum soli TaxID=2448455 RepID=A0A2P9HM23_9HYPH|nr:Phage tail protein [[Ochrobactrum] soli]